MGITFPGRVGGASGGGQLGPDSVGSDEIVDGSVAAVDLSSGVAASLGKADTAYQKPGSGIPASDLAPAVQSNLTLAGTAYQKPAPGIPLADIVNGPVLGLRVGHRINCIGASTTPQKTSADGAGAGGGLPTDWLAHASYYSGGRLIPWKLGGVAGDTVAMMDARVVVDALSDGGEWCTFFGTVNDGGVPTSIASYKASVLSIVGKIVTAGQTPILCSATPQTGNNPRSQDAYRQFCNELAAANGWPYVDWYNEVTDPSTRGWKAGLSTDGTHPNGVGAALMGKIFADTMAEYMPPFKPLLPVINDQLYTSNLVQNGCFLTDTNADGVPDGWSVTGLTGSLGTDVAVVGNAWRLQGSGTGSKTATLALGSPSTRRGNRLRFCGRVKNLGDMNTNVTLLFTDATNGNRSLRVFNSWNVPTSWGSTTWGTFQVEGVVPAACTAITIYVDSVGAADKTFDISLAQVGIYDMTVPRT